MAEYIEREEAKELLSRPITIFTEEVADVRIMLDQLCIMFGIEIRAQRHRAEKLERLQRRLETE